MPKEGRLRGEKEEIMLDRIDAWTIRRFEAFSHFTQVNFGLTSVTWERWCAVLGPVLFGAFSFNWKDVLDWMVAFILLVRFVAAMRPREIQDGFMNPEKLRGRISRVLGFYITSSLALPETCLGAYFGIWAPIFTAGYYFEACDDLPPSESRVKKWLRALTPGKQPQVEAV
jgi:hypothetical protein